MQQEIYFQEISSSITWYKDLFSFVALILRFLERLDRSSSLFSSPDSDGSFSNKSFLDNDACFLPLASFIIVGYISSVGSEFRQIQLLLLLLSLLNLVQFARLERIQMNYWARTSLINFAVALWFTFDLMMQWSPKHHGYLGRSPPRIGSKLRRMANRMGTNRFLAWHVQSCT